MCLYTYQNITQIQMRIALTAQDWISKTTLLILIYMDVEYGFLFMLIWFKWYRGLNDKWHTVCCRYQLWYLFSLIWRSIDLLSTCPMIWRCDRRCGHGSFYFTKSLCAQHWSLAYIIFALIGLATQLRHKYANCMTSCCLHRIFPSICNHQWCYNIH